MKTISLLIAAAAAPMMMTACSTSTPDELAGETSADEAAVDGKADAAIDGTSTYFEIRSDMRKCASPLCGGFFVSRLNRSYTTCVDRSQSAECYAPSLDWSESGVSEGLQQKLLDAAYVDATTEGVHAIVRGRFAPQQYAQGNLGRFVVSEAWVEEGNVVSNGVFVRAMSNHIECIAAPCPTITEKALNTARTANIAAIDFSPSGMQEREIASFYTALQNAGGVIIAGDRYTYTENGRSAKGRTANAAYSRLVDAPAQ